MAANFLNTSDDEPTEKTTLMSRLPSNSSTMQNAAEYNSSSPAHLIRNISDNTTQDEPVAGYENCTVSYCLIRLLTFL